MTGYLYFGLLLQTYIHVTQWQLTSNVLTDITLPCSLANYTPVIYSTCFNWILFSYDLNLITAHYISKPQHLCSTSVTNNEKIGV